MKNTKKSSNNISHPLRLMAGIYLLYLAYSLVKTWADLDNKLLFGIFIAIFGIIGLLLLITSGLALLRNRNIPASDPDVSDLSQEEPQAEDDSVADRSEEAGNKEDLQVNSTDQSDEDK